jgi:DNA-binding transcriptional regulator YiaG
MLKASSSRSARRLEATKGAASMEAASFFLTNSDDNGVTLLSPGAAELKAVYVVIERVALDEHFGLTASTNEERQGAVEAHLSMFQALALAKYHRREFIVRSVSGTNVAYMTISGIDLKSHRQTRRAKSRVEESGEMTPAQCRAARGLLSWTQDQLANASRVSDVTVRHFENDEVTPRRSSLHVMRRALEGAGVVFLDEGVHGPGVRLRKGLR